MRTILLALALSCSAPSASFRLVPGLIRGTAQSSAFAAGKLRSNLPSLRSTTRFRSHTNRAGFCLTRMSGGSATDKALAVVVYVTVKDGMESSFKEASLNNAKNSVQEEGISRFDFIQNKEQPNKFVLVEVYKNSDAPGKHKETAHYATWRDTVADMMAEPRSAVKYTNIFPGSFADWDVPASLKKGSSESAANELLAVHVFVHVTEGSEEKFKELSIENARNSVMEPGIARFDVLQEVDNPTKFLLVEVYSNPDAPAKHKETAHYAAWRDGVAAMMAEPRSALKYVNHFPAADSSWRAAKL